MYVKCNKKCFTKINIEVACKKYSTKFLYTLRALRWIEILNLCHLLSTTSIITFHNLTPKIYYTLDDVERKKSVEKKNAHLEAFQRSIKVEWPLRLQVVLYTLVLYVFLYTIYIYFFSYDTYRRVRKYVSKIIHSSIATCSSRNVFQ